MNKYYEEVTIRIMKDYNDIGQKMLEYAKTETRQYLAMATVMMYLTSDKPMDEAIREQLNDFCLESGYQIKGDSVDLLGLIQAFDNDETRVKELRTMNLRERNIDLVKRILNHPRGFFSSKLDKNVVDEFYDTAIKLQEIREQSLKFLMSACEFKLQLLFGGGSELIKAIVKETDKYDMAMEISHQNISNYQKAYLNSMLFTLPDK